MVLIYWAFSPVCDPFKFVEESDVGFASTIPAALAGTPAQLLRRERGQLVAHRLLVLREDDGAAEGVDVAELQRDCLLKFVVLFRGAIGIEQVVGSLLIVGVPEMQGTTLTHHPLWRFRNYLN